MDVNHDNSTRSFTLSQISPPFGAYSHGTIVNGFLFTSGMGPSSLELSDYKFEGIEEQTRRTFKNLEAILNEAGLNFSNVVKVTAYLQNIERDFETYDAICREFLSEPFPVRTTIGANLREILICIDCVAKL